MCMTNIDTKTLTRRVGGGVVDSVDGSTDNPSGGGAIIFGDPSKHRFLGLLDSMEDMVESCNE